jgi:hypothetical protein
MRATLEPMPENPTADKNGLWRVKVESEDGTFEYRNENVTHDEALKKVTDLNKRYREDKTLH